MLEGIRYILRLLIYILCVILSFLLLLLFQNLQDADMPSIETVLVSDRPRLQGLWI
jgi:hypothetical protein